MGKENLLPQSTLNQSHSIPGAFETNPKEIITTEEQILRNYQDTIFSCLYADPECVLDLYLTLHPEDKSSGITQDQVKRIALENVFLAQRYNDVAFQIGDKLIVLAEHQSTINENMPLRMLFYVANEYEKIISSFKQKLYREKLVKIPAPEFYVIYTGKIPWVPKELKLSEAFNLAGLETAPLEVSVRVICEVDIQTTQNTLGSYYNFIGFVKDTVKNGKIRIDAVERYINPFSGSRLFKKFLEKFSAEEVANMTNFEFNLEEAMAVWREEAMEEGFEEGMEKGLEKGLEKGIRSLMENMKFSLEQAMDALSIPVEEQPIYAARIYKQ